MTVSSAGAARGSRTSKPVLVHGCVSRDHARIGWGRDGGDG